MSREISTLRTEATRRILPYVKKRKDRIAAAMARKRWRKTTATERREIMKEVWAGRTAAAKARREAAERSVA